MADKKANSPAPAEAKKEEPKRVTTFIPYIEGEDPELTVGVNGVMYKIRKGEEVEVPVEVMEVIHHSNQQIMAFEQQRKELQSQDLG